MSSQNWKPWWEKVSDFDTPHEKEEFMRGAVGGRPSQNTSSSTLLLAVIAGYFGGKAANSKGKK